jgi:hypothetical protein
LRIEAEGSSNWFDSSGPMGVKSTMSPCRTLSFRLFGAVFINRCSEGSIPREEQISAIEESAKIKARRLRRSGPFCGGLAVQSRAETYRDFSASE